MLKEIENGARLLRAQSSIGYGFDALAGSYLKGSDVKVTYPILDMSALEILEEPSNESKYLLEAGSNVAELAESLSAKLGVEAKFLMFSGSLSTEFTSSKTERKETCYSKCIHYVTKQRRFLEGGEYRRHLKKDFTEDLLSLEPRKLFDRYGTHLITDICLGGRIEVNFTTKMQSNVETEELKTKLKVAYGTISATTSSEISQESKTLLTQSIIEIYTVGGGGYVFSGLDDNFHTQLKEWVESLQEKKTWDICYVANNSSMIPVWELCDNRERSEAIRDYYLEEAKKRRESMLPDIEDNSYVVDVLVCSDGNDNTAKGYCPKDYTLIEKDLNSGAGGNYIYLCYKMGPKKNAVTNLLIQDSDGSLAEGDVQLEHDDNKVTYHRLEQDLNKGARGQYRYLAMTRDTAFDPIKDLAVVFNDEPKPAPWKDVCWLGKTDKADINKGVKGKYVYIKYLR